ncbi:T9SS type A sorting domain-containing protein [Psychroserpens jangbogonensis]|uniref:T9SS type A sorting domain-containing protein n=1 Tax=Psychroserpens jangbogonensis TaxID=1484460 RepID=UPI000689F616|nr:T9SS type A sorting domain-containing protein [Psychroserpens jangbogonensis]
MKTRILLLLLTVFTMSSNAQTFNWEGGTTINGGGTYVRQTISGVQVECTNSSNALQHIHGGGFAGSSGYVVSSGPNTTSLTVSFNAAINIQSIYTLDGNSSATDDWTFTPIGGTNSNVVQSIGGAIGVNVNVNWTNVTAFTITSANGVDRFTIDDIVFTPYTGPTCTVNIPDANFKSYLVGNTAINTNNDTEIDCTEATAFTGTIYAYNLSILDLTGIEAFTNITELNTAYNSLTSIDVSNNTALTILNVVYNDLTSLDVSNNIALTELYCRSNYTLTSLDTSANTALTMLSCFQNAITSLDVSANTVLMSLSCSTNALTSLDISNNIALTELYCSDNSLTGLDVSTNTVLTELYCDENSLASLNISGATALLELYCGDNPFTSLDLSTNTALTYLRCNATSLTSIDLSANTVLSTLYGHNNTSLTSLNVANGNNSNFNYFYAADNSSLTCIEVDNVAWSDANWAVGKDTMASFSTNCSTLSVDEFTLNTVSLYPNPTTSVLNIEIAQGFNQAIIYSMLGKEILRTQNKNIDVSSLSNGLFLIKIENESGNVLSKRFIKQ